MTIDMTIFYVSDIDASCEFYSVISGSEPSEKSPGFALYVLDSGLKLGLWKASAVSPVASFSGSGSELLIHTSTEDEVEALHRLWSDAGLHILSHPVSKEFGLSFVAASPDGHRVRVLHAAD